MSHATDSVTGRQLTETISSDFGFTTVWLVGWLEFNVPFQHKYGYIRDESSGVESYPLTQ